MLACPNHPTEYDLRRCARCARSFCTNCVVLLRGSYYCADCKSEQIRDLQSGSEGSALDLASMGQRFVAMLVDGLVQGCAIGALFVPLFFVFGAGMATMGTEGQQDPPPAMLGAMLLLYGVMIVGLLLVPLVYEGLMLSRNGQTLGKMAMGLKVVTPDGADISKGQAWGRAGMRLALSLVCNGIIDWIPALFDAEKKCVHDMVARTRVVRIR